ncbi:beta-lactamase family protein [Chitinophagales bacterium]|nr:beta-lactamase family protein [Chitinophagales bacterium]
MILELKCIRPFAFLILLVLLSCQETVESEIKTPSDIVDGLEQLQEKWDSSAISGFGIAVVRNDSIVYSGGIGYADIERGLPYTNRTVQPLGSISKVFTATAIAKGIELGYFGLQTPINGVLPFEIHNPHDPDRIIRLFDLVTHSSGILDSDEYFWKHAYCFDEDNDRVTGSKHLAEVHFAKNGDCGSLAALMSGLFNKEGKWYHESNFAFGDSIRYNYSNAATALAGYIVEHKSGMPFHAFCKQHIFVPLGMKQTTFVKQEVSKEDAAILYYDKETPLPVYYLSSYPDGGLCTSPNDLAIYLREMMRGYRGESDLLKQSTFDLMFSKKFDQNNLPLDLPPSSNSGIFWDWMKSGRLGHNGSDPGLFTWMDIDTENNTGMLILLNHGLMYDDENRRILLGQLKGFVKELREMEKGGD